MFEELYTIVYYTASRENQEFEKKIIDNLKKHAGNIPIISVSQKPLDLGTNICVGDVGWSYLNEWRQILIGAKAAKIPYIIFAESDFLYPEDYFILYPTADMYIYDNVWIVMDKKYGNFYWKKRSSEGAQICKRDVLIREYERHLKGQPEWHDGKIIIGKKGDSPLMNVNAEHFTGDPCVSFKTGNGLKNVTNILKGDGNILKWLPVWGDIKELRKKYL